MVLIQSAMTKLCANNDPILKSWQVTLVLILINTEGSLFSQFVIVSCVVFYPCCKIKFLQRCFEKTYKAKHVEQLVIS